MLSVLLDYRQKKTVLDFMEPVTWVSVMGTVLAVAGLFLSEYSGKGNLTEGAGNMCAEENNWFLKSMTDEED